MLETFHFINNIYHIFNPILSLQFIKNPSSVFHSLFKHIFMYVLVFSLLFVGWIYEKALIISKGTSVKTSD